MKVRIWSDLHCDGAVMLWDKPCHDEILVLAGDSTNSIGRTATFVNGIHDLFHSVIVIIGNHEYYSGNITPQEVDIKFKEICSADNVHLLNPGSVKIEDVTFIGATLWSDFNKGDPIVMWAAGRGINDFRLMKIGFDYDKWTHVTPEWMTKQHKFELEYIREACKETEGKKVIITHFPPIRDFQHKKWGTISENPLNGYFMSDLDHEIMDLDFDLWIAGHTHDPSDFNKHNKRFIANPRGYMYKNIPENEKWNPDLVINI